MKANDRSELRCLYEFGDFRLDPNRRRLLRRGEIVPVSPKAIETLIVLVRNPGRILEREELMQAVWAGAIVEDANLTVAISQLRKAFGQNGDPDQFIQTVSRVGYRFVAEVRETVEESPPVKLQEPATRRANGNEEGASERDAASRPASVIALTGIESRILIPALRLNRLPAVATVLILTLAVIAFSICRLRSRHTGPVSAVSKPTTLAVLPFQSTPSATADDQYLATSVSDSLGTRLGTIKQFAVRPTSSVLTFGDHRQDPLEAGRKLEVEHILEGRIERRDDRIRVLARLWRVADRTLVWADSFDEQMTSLFAFEENISRRVTEALRLNVTPDEQQRLASRNTANPDALHAYLRGRHAWNKRTPDEIRKAIKFFQQAIDLDPTYAAAHAGLADCYLALGDYAAAPPDETFPLAKGAALRALEIDDELAEAHATLAHAKFLFYRDWAAAEREYLRAIELKPNHPTAHHWYGLFLAAKGRGDEAMREVKLAQDLDPLSLIIRANVGMIEYFGRNYDQAIEHERKVLEADPNFVPARRKLAYCLEAKGMEEEAVAEWLTVEQQIGTDDKMLEDFKKASAASGIRGYWQLAVEIEKKETGNEAGALSSYYARLGDREQAFLWLDRACDQHAPWLVYAKVTPVYDNLRGDPRFDAFLQRIGL